jgi:catechol 2,3-dioxygenase-like lactoylglutathione lyase family enzyme
MIQRLGIASIYVLNQESAKRFFTDKLGFTVQDDATFGPFRWLTVCPPGQPELRLALMLACASPTMDKDAAEALRGIIAKGGLGFGAFLTDDCQSTYAELSAKGVRFLSPPTRRPYGLEAIMTDDSGNSYSLCQR